MSLVFPVFHVTRKIYEQNRCGAALKCINKKKTNNNNEKPICFVIRSHTTVKVRRQYANATTDLGIFWEGEGVEE